MPISITINLTSPTNTALRHKPLPGRANYANVLSCIQSVDPTLSQMIHDGEDGPKPITCSGLLDERGQECPLNRDGTSVRGGAAYKVRITGLLPNVTAALARVLGEDPPEEWTIADHCFNVTSTTCDPAVDPWTGHDSYEELAAQQLLQHGQVERKVRLLFASPTSFKSKGMHLPVPLPNLVFGSLVERWNHFSPVTLSPEMRRFGEEAVALSNYEFGSRTVGQKGKGAIIGGVGRATYSALGGDRYWLASMQMLADFALYSGVGVKTTTGMGQVKKMTT